MTYLDTVKSPVGTQIGRRSLLAADHVACEHSLEHWIVIQQLVEAADNEMNVAINGSDSAAETYSPHRKPSASDNLR